VPQFVVCCATALDAVAASSTSAQSASVIIRVVLRLLFMIVPPGYRPPEAVLSKASISAFNAVNGRAP